ncbi:MAG: YkvA family protein [Chloroflexota bacterium]
MPNDKRPVIYDENLNFFRNLILQARLVWLLMRDPRVPLWLKVVPVSALAYVILPFDISPDVIPILGQLDDIAALMIGFGVFINLAPAEIVEEHMQTLTGHGSGWEVKQQSKPRKESNTESDILETTVIDGSYTEPPPEEK